MLALALMLGSCDDFLNHLPDNRAELDTEEKVAKLLISAYPLNSFAFMCEMASDNTDDNSSDFSASRVFQQEVFNWEELTDARTNDGPYRMWENTYKAIASANLAIEAIQKMGNPETLNPQKGEALMCRAFGHFLLSYMFCKPYSSTAAQDMGLPYITEPESEVFGNYTRGTLEQLYKNISDDIDAGLPLVDDRAYSVPKYHFNRKAAYAFATRFNLYYRKYDKAVRYADQVLGADPGKYLRDWETWGALSQNGIVAGDAYVNAAEQANLLMYTVYSNWARNHAPVSGFINNGSRYTHNKTIANAETLFSDGPWGNYNASNSPYHYNIWWTDASRKVCMRKINEYFQTTNITASGSSGFAWNLTTQFTTDLVLLEKAEANALAGNIDDAMANLTVFMDNFLKTTPTKQQIIDFYNGIEYYTPLNATPKKKFNTDMPITAGEQENVLHCILHLKRILTIHEGLRWNDINRYGIEVWRRTVYADGTIAVGDKLEVGDNRRVFQLPEEVISAGMTPNPR